MYDIVRDLYSDYGKYINEFRSFPSILDGCKLVERRLLYCVYTVAKSSKVKAARIVGDCIGKYHPHGDSSCYSSLVHLVQNEFVEGQGNWGNNIGVESSPAAAMRYTEAKADKDILNMAFEYIESIPKIPKELDPEPAFLPTKLPFCLLGNYYTQGIGFGYKTYFPCFTKQDLTKRLKWLLGYLKTEPIIKPKTDCSITSSSGELKNLLTTGKQKISFKGSYTVDIKNNSIIIHCLPPGKSFTSFLKKFEKEIQIEKSLGWVDESSKGKTNVRIKILRQRGYPISKLQNKIDKEIEGSVSFECNVVDVNGKVSLISVDKLLLNVYNVYKKVFSGVTKSEINVFSSKIDEQTNIGKIKPHLSTEIKDNPDDINKVIDGLSKKSKLDKETVKGLINKHTISKLFRLKDETKELQDKKKELEKVLQNADEVLWKTKYE